MHTTLVKLFVMTSVPPDIVRLFLLVPTTEIAEPVADVTSSKVVPFGVTNVRRIPEFVKLKSVEFTRVKVCPVLVALTENVAPRNPVIE